MTSSSTDLWVNRKVWLAFWLAAVFWGTSYLWIKLGLQNWNPVALVAYRLTFAAILFTLALYITGIKVQVRRGRRWVLPLVAILNPYVPFVLISWAELSIDTGLASILNATVPLFMLVLTPFFLPEERPTWRSFLGTLIGFIGVALLFGDSSQGALAGSELLGQAAVLLAALLYAISAVLLRRYNPGTSPLAQAAVLNGYACIFVWGHAMVAGLWQLPPEPINWLAVVWLGTLGSFAAYTAAMYVLEKKGATHVTLINFAYPLMAMILGAVFLAEAFTSRLVVGGALILSGIALVRVRRTP